MIQNELLKRFLSSIILIPCILLIILKGSLLFNLFITLCFLLSLYEWSKMNKKIVYKIIGAIYLFFSFWTFYQIRNYFDSDYHYLLLVLTICILTDLGGYLFGKLFKGPKLTTISPNKTYSGVFGSFLLPLVVVMFFEKFDPNSLIQNNIIFILIVSLISQLGDVLVSYFKRKSKIKDTGKIIPGHGGILDRIDGMIFAFPASYIILILYKTNFF